MNGALTDLFEVLGLPRRFDVAADELERRFHDRSRAMHPDRFARATPAERRAALERTTRLNHAYRTLRDPWRRAEHLVTLLHGAGGPQETGPEPAFLEEQLAAREALAEARRRRDGRAIEALRRSAAEALSTLERELGRALAEKSHGDLAAAAVQEARRLLGRARFHQALLDEAERASDPGRPGAPRGPGREAT